MSADPDDDLSASLHQLATQTSAAASTLRRRVTLTDVTTPTPGTARVSLAPRKTPANGAPAPTTAPAGEPRISLSGSTRGQPSPTPAPVAMVPSWVQDGREASHRASKTLVTRVPAALAAMTAVTASGSTPAPLVVRAPVARPESVTTAAAVTYACSLVLLAMAATASGVAEVAAAGGLGAVLLGVVLRFVWLHRVWRVLPAADLVDDSGNRVTPGGAVGRHFIPFYNLYWVFAARGIVCRALAGAAASAGVPKDSPRVAGALAGLADLIPYANVIVGPLFSIVFMTRVDAILARIRKAQTPRPVGN